MKKNKSTLTPMLRQNWWIDALLGGSALLAIISSLYFLAFPNSGYQGGRNPYYSLVVIFSRKTWDLLHTWSGVSMIFAAFVHIIIHWGWITGTINRTWQVILGKRQGFSPRLTYNIFLDFTIAISFMICALSGFVFIFFPASGPTGSMPFFEKFAWDMLHTWSGVLMSIGILLHFTLHWKWITNITRKMFFKNSNLPANPGIKVEPAA
jgi:cytochrome b subunit of formate dehydrogenase